MKKLFTYLFVVGLFGCEALGIKKGYCYDCLVELHTDKGKLVSSQKGEYCNKDYDNLIATKPSVTTTAGITVTIYTTSTCTKK